MAIFNIKDVSGRNNDWIGVNLFQPHNRDQAITHDTIYANWPTLFTTVAATTTKLHNGNLSLTANGTTANSYCRLTHVGKTEKVYWEAIVDSGTFSIYTYDSISGTGTLLLTTSGTDTFGFSIDFGTGEVWTGTNVSGSPAYRFTPNPIDGKIIEIRPSSSARVTFNFGSYKQAANYPAGFNQRLKTPLGSDLFHFLPYPTSNIVVDITSSQTWNNPWLNVYNPQTKVKIEVLGAGGGGGGGGGRDAGTKTVGASGGSGGGYIVTTVTLAELGASLYATIGAGGRGGYGSQMGGGGVHGQGGVAGGNTTFFGLTATGGQAGGGNPDNWPDSGVGAAGTPNGGTGLGGAVGGPASGAFREAQRGVTSGAGGGAGYRHGAGFPGGVGSGIIGNGGTGGSGTSVGLPGGVGSGGGGGAVFASGGAGGRGHVRVTLLVE